MSRIKKKSPIMALVLLLIFVLALPAAAAVADEGGVKLKDEQQHLDLQRYLQATAAWLVQNVPQPTSASVGGEWAVIGLARSDCEAPPSWYDTYYNNLLASLEASEGVLSNRKYTEYSRAILALTALGKDPTQVGGYNLLSRLADYDQVLLQGLNGPIFALLALDSGAYAMPACAAGQQAASRQMYVDYLLSRQNTDGGWSLGGSHSEPDITAMALQALAQYQHQAKVKEALAQGVLCLAGLQNESGDFVDAGSANVESAAQVVVALCELKIDPRSSQFSQNGRSALDSLLSYYVDGGGFKHILTARDADTMGTEQGFYALAAYQRYLKQKSSFYDMAELSALPRADRSAGKAGAADKNAEIRVRPITRENLSFADIQGMEAQSAIEALAAREIINGFGNNIFAPRQNMTRAEFAASVVRALGLTPSDARIFNDVAESSWYAAYVASAYDYGIVSGMSADTFAPEATISRAEAAVMVTRAAGLAGLDIFLTEAEVQRELGYFTDSADCPAWSREALAFAYRQGILAANDDAAIQPTIAVTRAEIAVMLYRLLGAAQLI